MKSDPFVQPISTVVVSIATYKRPMLLTKLLDSLSLPIEGCSVRVVVVDNDPAQSAKEIVGKYDSAFEYLAEPQPGIAAARNAGLAVIRDEHAVIFIDDDEYASEGWLKSLIGYANHTGADVVTGPVLPNFDSTTPDWLETGGFWQRRRLSTGTEVDSVATNNTLLRTSLLRRGNGVRFSEALSHKGGSDTEFFRQIREPDDKFLWCDEAIVIEWILPERARVGWLFRRAVRIGNINSRYMAKRPSAVAGGLARIMIGAPYALADRLIKGHFMARSLNMLGHGIGMLGNSVRLDVNEYKRSASSRTTG